MRLSSRVLRGVLVSALALGVSTCAHIKKKVNDDEITVFTNDRGRGYCKLRYEVCRDSSGECNVYTWEVGNCMVPLGCPREREYLYKTPDFDFDYQEKLIARCKNGEFSDREVNVFIR